MRYLPLVAVSAIAARRSAAAATATATTRANGAPIPTLSVPFSAFATGRRDFISRGFVDRSRLCPSAPDRRRLFRDGRAEGRNRYARFRRSVAAKGEGVDGGGAAVAQMAFAVLAKKGRTWRRLGHMVELACDGAAGLSTKEGRKGGGGVDDCGEFLPSVADVGCDHGLLAIGLAASGSFGRVLGTDASLRALGGALHNYDEVLEVLSKVEGGDAEQLLPAPVEFRVGDGLRCIEPGEADALCVAGMGVNTIVKILFGSENRGGVSDLDRVGCRKLFLQPTNSKPRNLMRLYDQLRRGGWDVEGERIEYLSKRWYVSAVFARDLSMLDDECECVPGCILRKLSKTDDMWQVYQNYVYHHLQWIERDMSKKGGQVLDDEAKWIELHQHDQQQ